jgi:hypothetical protein
MRTRLFFVTWYALCALAIAWGIFCIVSVRGSEAQATADHFPPGVPVNATELTWYSQADEYQMTDGPIGGISGWYSRHYNISANRAEPFGNANLEFPWRTGGIDKSRNAKGSTFCNRLAMQPRTWQAAGGRRQRVQKGTTWNWREGRGHIEGLYPDGSVVGELLQVKEPREAEGRTFEVRLMTKVQGQWQFRTFRRFGKRAELAPFIVAEKITVDRLVNKHPETVVDLTGLVDEIELSAEGVRQVFSWPMKDVTGEVFYERDGHKCFAPTAGKGEQVVPVGYQGGFFGADSCKKCHDTVGKSVSEFQLGRDWYGYVRGIDGIFSRPVPH